MSQPKVLQTLKAYASRIFEFIYNLSSRSSSTLPANDGLANAVGGHRLNFGKQYSVIKSFVDYDGFVHKPGENWVFQGTGFLPYDDGLTLHVLINNAHVVYRLQNREEKQAEIIKNFDKYVHLS